MLDEKTRPTTRRAGIALAAVTAVVSGCAVFINGYGVRSWAEVSDATTYTTFKNAVAAAVLVAAGLALAGRGSTEAPRLPAAWETRWKLVAIAIVGGSVPFVLFFEGFAQASSSQAAFIHKTLVIWVGVMAVMFLKERVGPLHVLAIALLVWGQAVLVGGLSEVTFGVGEVMMLGATLLWSVETIVAKRVLVDVPAMTVGIARMAGGAVVLVLFGIVRGGFAGLAALQPSHVGWVLVTGAVLAAYVGSWYMALARAQAVDVTAVLVGGALLTAALNVGVRGIAAPTLGGLVLVAAGVVVAIAAALGGRWKPQPG